MLKEETLPNTFSGLPKKLPGWNSTVDNHKARLMGKLGVNKATLATRLAILHGVSPMDDRLTPAEQRASGRSDDGWN